MTSSKASKKTLGSWNVVKNTLIAIYILAVLTFSAVARAGDSSTSDVQNYNFKSLVGEVVALADGALVLAMADQQRFVILKSQVELTPFIGSNVMISGIELEHQLAPSFDLDAVDPLPGFGYGNKAVIFYVFGINEVR